MDKVFQLISLSDGELVYFPRFLRNPNISFNLLKNELKWRQDEIKMFGKIHKVPRLQAWYGDSGLSYSYSGIKLDPLEWTEELLRIKTQIEHSTSFAFNSVLANLYRDGQDSNGWHADNEKELGVNPIIASVSLGKERVFKMKHRNTKEKFNILLENGSLLIMKGRTQHTWLHTISKSKKIKEERINLTFRKIITNN